MPAAPAAATMRMRELGRIGVRFARADRDARSGTRRPPCSPPSPSRHTPAPRSPRTRRRRSGRGTRTSPAATSRTCRRSRSRVPCVRRARAGTHANAGWASPAPAGRPRAPRHRAAYVARPARSCRRRRYRYRHRAASREASARRRRRASWGIDADDKRHCVSRQWPDRDGGEFTRGIRRIDEQRMTLGQPSGASPRDRHSCGPAAAYAIRTERRGRIPNAPARTTATRPRARSRRNIALKSREGPATSMQSIASSPLRSCGAKRVVSSVSRAPDRKRMPAPSSSTIVRSMPGKRENGPSRSTSAMLTRHKNSSSAAPGRIARRSRSCVLRRSSTASGDNRRA